VKKLTVREAAALLNASEKSVYRWIKQGLLPAYRINDQYRINRAELLEWATARKLHVSPEIFAEPEARRASRPSDARARRHHYRVGGTTRPPSCTPWSRRL
jgi:PTS system nitrogen regulatory IIA component